MKKTYLYASGFLVLFFVIFSFFFVDPNLIFLKPLVSKFYINHSFFVTILYTIFILLFFISYFLITKNRKKLPIKSLYVLTAFSIVAPLFAYPSMLSYDIFNYALTSKVLFFYRENPYLLKPIEFLHDPWLEFTRATNKISLYGPLWLIIGGIPFFLSLGNYVILLLNFKILNALFLAGSIVIFSKLSKNKEDIILFALNPLILIETMVSGHNDISMVFFMLTSAYFLYRKKTILGSTFFLFSILIKYASLIALPIYLFMIIKNFKKKSIDLKKIFTWIFYCMFAIFIFSFLREEIYPWYALWFLPFGFLSESKKLKIICFLFSLSLLLSYVPYMYLRSYISLEVFLKMAIIFTIPVFGYPFFRKLKWIED